MRERISALICPHVTCQRLLAFLQPQFERTSVLVATGPLNEGKKGDQNSLTYFLSANPAAWLFPESTRLAA